MGSKKNHKYESMVLNLAIEFESIYCKREVGVHMQYSIYQNALTQFILDRLIGFNYDITIIIGVINRYKPHNIEWILPDHMKGMCLREFPERKIDWMDTIDTLDIHYNRILCLI